MNIGIYAGSIRPGGGLTVLKQAIEALAVNEKNTIFVYTGANDTSESIAPLFSQRDNVIERRFLPGISMIGRYAASKVLFPLLSLFHRLDRLITFNYYVPSFCPVIVYHINLLSFMVAKQDSLGMRIKRLDAKLACRFADKNIFESKYLENAAVAHLGHAPRNPAILYVGVDEAFSAQASMPSVANSSMTRILMVSSVQPHKDNTTGVKALQRLYELRPEVDWHMTIVGGQSVAQWQTLADETGHLGVAEHIKYLGPVSKPELTVLMRQSLCLISASQVESFCMVALESMAAGCPAIVTSATSMPESVENAALLVESGSAQQFAESIIQLHDDSALREEYIRRGHARASKLSIRKFSEKLRELVHEV